MSPGRHRVTPLPEITAGEPEHGAWCAVCQVPSRIRVPLLIGGRPAGGIEFCPGCGTGHDKPAVHAVPPLPVIGTQRAPRAPWLARVAGRLHARACRRDGLRAELCAWADCPWPGLWRNSVEVPGEEGTWRYVFCRAAHRERWAAESGL